MHIVISRPFTAGAVALFLVAAALRVWHLGQIPGLNADEAWYGVNALDVLHHRTMTAGTPTDNFVNSFYFLPLLLLHALLPPSILLLRCTAVAYGLLALAVNWLLCRRVFGAATATVTTLLLAVLPEDIAQSRLGWDPSQSLLADAIVYYLALLLLRPGARAGLLLVLSLVALCAAIAVHPTNVFMAIVVLGAVLMRWRTEVVGWLDPRRPGLRWIAAYAGIAVAVAGALAWKWDWFVGSLRLLLHTDSVALFPDLYLRLFWGMTVFRYVAGSCEPGDLSRGTIWAATLCTGLLFVPVLWYAARALGQRLLLSPEDRLVFAGWLAQLLCFLVVGGSLALIRGNERYAMGLIVPAVVAVTRAARLVTAGSAALRLLAGAGWLVLSAALLGSFYINYFQFILRTGGAAHDTFRTAAVEPKLAAWRVVSAQLPQPDQGPPSVVVAGTWWSLQPLRYFSAGTGAVQVLLADDIKKDRVLQDQVAAAARAGRLWYVEFVRSDANDIAALRQAVAAEPSLLRETLIPDYAGQPVIDVLHIIVKPPS